MEVAWYETTQFEFGWAGLRLVMISGGFGGVGVVALLGDVPGGVAEFVVYGIVLSSIAPIAAAAVEGRRGNGGLTTTRGARASASSK